jgi:hypothetical protein
MIIGWHVNYAADEVIELFYHLITSDLLLNS